MFNLHALKDIEEVVHPCEMLNILKNGHQQCGNDGDWAGQQNSRKTGPAQVQETLQAHGGYNKATQTCSFSCE